MLSRVPKKYLNLAALTLTAFLFLGLRLGLGGELVANLSFRRVEQRVHRPSPTVFVVFGSVGTVEIRGCLCAAWNRD